MKNMWCKFSAKCEKSCSRNYYRKGLSVFDDKICLADFAVANRGKNPEKWLISEFEMQVRGAIDGKTNRV
jgi:hypothetical protein